MPRFDDPLVRFDDPLVRYDDPREYSAIIQPPTTTMSYEVVLEISKLKPEDLVTRGETILSATAGTPVFATLAPKITALQTLASELDGDNSAVTNAKNQVTSAVARRSLSQGRFIGGLNDLAIDIGRLATSEADIIAVGLRVKGKPTARSAPGKVTDLALSFGDEEGELDATWDADSDADFYEGRYTTGDPLSSTADWHNFPPVTKSSATLPHLPSGAKVWVQYRAANARGTGPWSDPVSKRVP